VIEMPMSSSNKYEHNAAPDSFVLDRVLHSPLYYPTEYGWVPGTLSEDGDPSDILVFVSHPTFPGCVICARVNGERGEDNKAIAVADTDPRCDELRTLDGLADQVISEAIERHKAAQTAQH
jgi:inorganic pyrophosphatase